MNVAEGGPSKADVTCSAEPSHRRRFAGRGILAAIVVVGALLRLAHFAAIRRTAFLDITRLFTDGDQYGYWQWAKGIVAGDLIGRAPFHPYTSWMQAIAPLETWERWGGGKTVFTWAPLYPYWVAGLFAVSGNSLEFVALVQLLVGALQPLVVFALARRVFDRRVALLAAAITASYGPFIFHEGTLLRDWLPPILEPLALVALLRARASGHRVDWAIAGGALGLALLVKESILFFIAAVCMWIAVEYGPSVAQAARVAAGVAFGLALSVSPLVIRNCLVGAPPLAISAGGGGVIAANAADAFPVGPRVPASTKGILERSDGRVGRLLRETLATYHGDWRRVVHLVTVKLRGLADPLEIPNNVSMSYGLDISPPLRPTLRYSLVFPLGVVGIALAVASRRRHLLTLSYMVATTAGLMVPNVLARYRLVLVPPLIIYGSAAVIRLVDAVRAGRRTTAAMMVAAIGVVVVAQQLVLPLRELRADPFVMIHPPEYQLSADSYATGGRLDRAVAEMRRLREKAVTGGFGELAASAALGEGKYHAMWAQRLLKETDQAGARAQVELARAAYAGQMQLGEPNFVLGILYTNLQQPASARPFLERFLTLEPEGERATLVRHVLAGSQSPKD